MGQWLRGNAIGIAGAVLMLSFFIGWLRGVSGLDIARQGGTKWLLLAIPAMGGVAAHAGFTRGRHMHLAAFGAAMAVLVPLLGSAAWHSGWRMQGLLVIGVVLLACGARNTAKELALPLGLILVAVAAYVALRVGSRPSVLANNCLKLAASNYIGHARFRVLVALAHGLAYLLYAIPIAASWMTVTGLLGRGQRPAMIATGALILGAFAYAILLVAYAATATFGDLGLWGTLLATVVLLVSCIGVGSPDGPRKPAAVAT